jgi:hypothetical protein
MTDQIFDHSIGIVLDIKIWSGSKNLKPEDFKGIELPPDELISLGSKRLHNKDTLKPIQAVRTRAVTFMESMAVSLYGGKIWLVPADKLNEAQSLLLTLPPSLRPKKQGSLPISMPPSSSGWIRTRSGRPFWNPIWTPRRRWKRSSASPGGPSR